MNKIPNRQAICDALIEAAQADDRVVVLCSDSRGSASLTAFANAFPHRFVELGIAEQDLVGVAAGLAKSGMLPFAASPACFLSTRSYEQVKIDCAYSNTNVKLIGISGGVSYGSLGMSHHSSQDFAALCALPNMRVYCPSDRFQTKKLIKALLMDDAPAYIRVGRSAVEDVYTEADCPFEMDRATELRAGQDIALIACGEMVKPTLEAAKLLAEEGVQAAVLDMYCLKPLDRASVLRVASAAKCVLTVEEHSPYGGLGAEVAQLIAASCPRKVVNMALPDAPVIAGTSQQVFEHYGLTAAGIAAKAKETLA